MMTLTHVFFSPGGETACVARHVQHQTGGVLIDLTPVHARQNFDLEKQHEHIALYVPVYAGHVPKPLMPLLQKLRTHRLSIFVTYGGVTAGITVREVASAIHHTCLCSYAIIPVKHTYGGFQNTTDLRQLDPLIRAMTANHPNPVTPPNTRWPLWLDWTESLRTRFNYRLKHHPERCTQCKRCKQACPVQAIKENYRLDPSCLRCGRCVRVCQTSGFTATRSWFLKRYLAKPRKPILRLCFHPQDSHA